MPLNKPIFIFFKDDIDRDLKRKFSRKFQLKLVRVLKFKKKSFSVPKRTFDYLLVTSQTTLQLHRRFPKAKKVILIGEQTAKFWKGQKPIVLGSKSSKDILKFFSKQKGHGTIFFPRSTLGDVETVKALQRMKYRVTMKHSYETSLVSPRKELSKILSKKPERLFSAFLSPSGISAVRKSGQWKALVSRTTAWIAIGDTTKTALKKLGIKAHRPKLPSLQGILDLAQTLARRG